MWMSKSRRMRWAEYVAHTEHMDRFIQGFHDETSRKQTTWKTYT
jgi:hypothetical protein